MNKFIKINYFLPFEDNKSSIKYINISDINEIYEDRNGNAIIKVNYMRQTYNLQEKLSSFINRINEKTE